MKKKALSLLLVLAMCLTLLPTAVLAADEQLDGRQGIVITKDTVNGTTWTDGNGGTATWTDYSYLTLNNYNVDSGSNPAITIGYGCFVTLKGSNSLTSDSENGAIDFSPATGATYVNIRGTGTLDVNGGSHSAFKEFDRYCHMRVGGTAVVKLSNNSDTEPIFAAIDNPYAGTPLEDMYKSLGNNGIIEINDSGKLFVYGETKSVFDGMNASVYGSVNKNADESDLTEEAVSVDDYYTVNGETAQTLLFTKKISYAASVTTADGSTTTKYEDVKSAVTAAKQEAGCTIKIIAETNQLSLPDGIYLDTTGDDPVTFDLNGHSLGGYSLNIGGNNRSGKVNIIDSSNGNGAIGLAVRDGGDVTFNGATATSCLQLEAYSGSSVKFYGGNIRAFSLNNDVTYKDLLPEDYCYYTYRNGASLTSPVKLADAANAVTAGNYLAVGECQHKSVGSDMKCEYCGKDFSGYEAMLTTASGSVTYYETFSAASETAQKSADSTIKLLKDVKVSGNGLNFFEGTFTVDLNGKNLTGGYATLMLVPEKSSSQGSTAKVTLINTADNESTVGEGTMYAVQIDGKDKNTKLTVGRSDGTANNIKFLYKSMGSYAISVFPGTVELYGGTYVAERSTVIYGFGRNTALIIHGGSYTGATGAVYFDGRDLTIEGGEFKATNSDAFALVIGDERYDVRNVELSGGTFHGISAERPLSELLKDGYSFKKTDGDGSWLTETELAATSTTETVAVVKKPLKSLTVKINGEAVEDSSCSATVNEELTFTVETDPANADATVTWSIISGTTVTSLTDGSYTPNKSGTYTLKCEAKKDGYSLTKTVTITVVGAASITAVPENAEIVYGATELPESLAKLTATIKDGYSITAQWFVQGQNGAAEELTSNKALTNEQSYGSATMSILDAGTYQVYCHLTVRNSENIAVDEFNSDSVALTVKQKTLTATDLTYTGAAITKVYDGETTCATSASDVGINITKVQPNDTLPTVNGTFAYVSKNVSDNVKIIFTTERTESANYILPSGLNLELSGAITPCEVTISGIQATDRPYKANDKSVQLTGGSVVGVCGNDEVTVDLSKAKGEMADDAMGQNKPVTVTGAVLSGKDAGNYTLKAQPTGVTVNITKAVFAASVSMNGYTYGAETVPASSVSYNPEDGTVMYYYSTENSNQAGLEWKNITGATLNAGTYYMYAVISETSNYASVTTEPTEFVIGPKTLTKADLTYSGATEKVYDGTTNAPVGAKVSINSDALVGEDTLDVTGTIAYDTKDVATATKITFTPNAIESGNYRLAASEVLEVKASITAKTLTGLDFSSIEVTKVYDGMTDEGTLTGTVNFTGVVDKDEVSIKAVPSAYADANVGENNKTIVLTLSLEGSDKANYMLAEADRTHEFATASITKANGAVTPPTAKNLTYTGEAQKLVNEGSSMTGTIKYKLGDGDYSAELPMATDAGEYIVHYMVEGDENHNDVDAASIKVSIAKATPALKITADKNTLSGGGTVKLTVSGAPEGSQVVVTQTDDQNSEAKILALTGNGEVSVSLSNTTAKYTFTVVYAGDDNYNEKEDSCEVSVTRRTSSGTNSGNTITVPSTPNGTVTVNPSTATKGTTVTITTKPNEGYELGDLAVKDANGNPLPLTDKGDGKYTFPMPASKVEVKATFVKEVETSPFADVATDAYYYEAVKWAADQGITGGIGNGLFGPNQPCTRAQIVTFLWRAAGSPEPKNMSSFSDVPANSYYAKAVAWAVENGIATGTGDGKFSPDATCTRAQSVTFLFRAAKASANSTPAFSDVAANAYYAEAVKWATDNGITNGIGNGLFGSNNDCTRAQIVTFLWRLYAGK